MNFRSSRRVLSTTLTVTLGIITSTFLSHFSPILDAAAMAAPADSTFPDIQSYWGQPFIRNLAEQDIVTGYPDNTYRPE